MMLMPNMPLVLGSIRWGLPYGKGDKYFCGEADGF
jgi:hypothetical protein